MATHSRSLAIALTCCACTAWAGSSIDVLRKALDSRRTTAASLIQVQTAFEGAERIVTKVEYDGKGRSRRTMLQPLRMQGHVYIDDGKSVTTILPDSQTIKTIASRPPSNDFRLELIGKNYQLSSVKGERIAGRTTIKIFCRPKAREMPSRRITVDQETYIPLRVASIYQGKESVLLDTLSFETPKEMPSSLFTAPTSGRTKVVKIPSPVRVKDEVAAAEYVPFQPWVPQNIPLGFAVESLEVLLAGKGSVLALRLTDGFNMATIYQWDANFESHFPHSSLVASRNLRFSLLGDLPDAIRGKLKEYLCKGAMAL